jgi:hypothetical protein
MWGRLVLCWAQTSGFAARCRFLHASRCRRSLAALAIILTLGGCSASKLIDIYAADYRDTAASAGDAQLLLNILRAKDNLPIHFSDLSMIHGSIQWTAGASTIVPWAHFLNSATPSQSMPTLGAQTTPTFDLGTLDTQDFTRGLLQPLDPNIVKAFFNQGVDPRVMLLLFFSEYQGPDGNRYLNNMSCDPTHRTSAEGRCYNRVYDYLGPINRLAVPKRPLRASVYVELTPVGGELSGKWSLDNLGDLSGLDPKKYKLKNRQLYAISDPQLALCYEFNHRLYSALSRSGEACPSDEVFVHPGPEKKGKSLAIRSVYDIIQYLGQVLRFQEERGENRCVTLDAKDRHCDSGDVLFQVNAPGGTPVVATNYANGRYAISARECTKIANERCDHSLETLAVLELLLNANKAAKDIPSTPRVQVVQ